MVQLYIESRRDVTVLVRIAGILFSGMLGRGGPMLIQCVVLIDTGMYTIHTQL